LVPSPPSCDTGSSSPHGLSNGSRKMAPRLQINKSQQTPVSSPHPPPQPHFFPGVQSFLRDRLAGVVEPSRSPPGFLLSPRAGLPHTPPKAPQVRCSFGNISLPLPFFSLTPLDHPVFPLRRPPFLFPFPAGLSPFPLPSPPPLLLLFGRFFLFSASEVTLWQSDLVLVVTGCVL